MTKKPPTTDDLRKLTGAPLTGQPLVDEQDFAGASAPSPRPPWTQPIPKLMLVGIALTPVVVIAGLFLLGSHQSSPEQPATSNRQSTQNQKQPETATNDLEQTRQENAHLKAKAALEGQQQVASQVNKPTGKPIQVEQTKAPGAATASQPGGTPSSPYLLSRSEPPKIVTAPSHPMRETNGASSPEQFRSNQEQSADAMQRWQQLARLGSYGSLQPERTTPMEWSPSTQTATAATLPTSSSMQTAAAATSPASLEPAIARIAPTSAVQVSSRLPVGADNTESGAVPTVAVNPAAGNQKALPGESTPPEAEQPRQSPPVPILREAESRILGDPVTPPALIAGEYSDAVLATPVVIDNTSKKQGHFMVVLAEPLMDSRGSIAMPARAQLVVQVDDISTSGQVQLSATTAAWQEQGQTKEIILPARAIQVRGKDGNPLIAGQFTDKGREIAALDTGQFVLGVVRRSAQLYTRSNTRVQSSNGTTVVTEESPPPNILAGALEGGTDAVLNTISARNQRAVGEIQNRPPIHFIKAGSPVQVFVNQSMQLPI